jgi:hypothetical protein
VASTSEEAENAKRESCVMQQGLVSNIIHGIMAFLFALKFTLGRDTL